MLTCVNCGQARDTGRRLCSDCYKDHKRKQARLNYKIFGRYKYYLVCTACGNSYESPHSDGKFCGKCWKLRNELYAETKATNDYIMTKDGNTEHRVLAESILGKLNYNEVVHHLDENHRNNQLINLLIMIKSDHVKLHNYLADQRVIFEKSKNENPENCWKALRAKLTTAWLETTGAKVRKLI